MALDDYGALLRSGQAAVPDYAAQEAQSQLLKLKKQELSANLAELQRKQQQQAQFQDDLHGVLLNPSADNVSALILKHPEFADQVKSAWDLKDKAAQKADLTQMGSVYSAAQNGKWDLAAQSLQSRIDADKAAGQDSSEDQAILEALKSGDPIQQKAALGMIGTHLAAVAGPDHFASVMGGLKGGYTLDAGAVRFDDNGNVVARSPYLKTADGGILEADGTGGGGQTSGAAGSTAPIAMAPAAASVASALSSAGLPAPVVAGFMGNFHAEGGYQGAQGDGGSASGIAQWRNERAANFQRIIGKPVTEATPEEQAKFVAWEMQNPEAAGMTVKQRDAILNAKTPAQAAALIDQYYERSSGKDRQVRMSAATAFAGQAPASDGAPPGYHWLTQPKPKDAPTGYRFRPDGSLEPIPGGPAVQDEGIDDATATFYAQQMLAGGQMPTLGMGKAAAQARQQILKKVAQIAGADGLTGNDLAVQVGHYKANLANVQNLEKQAGTIEQNEQTAMANGQQFLDRSKELSAQTRFPIVNSVTQSYLRHTGDPTIAAMDSAWNTFVTEYAKVVAGSPSGAGVLSDSARHEAMETMKGNYSLQQKDAAFKQMQADMANRMAAIKAQIAKGYKSLGSRAPGIGTNSNTDTGLPKGAKFIGTYQGKRVIEVNGKRMVEQ